MKILFILKAASLIYFASTKPSDAALPCRSGTSFNLTITVDDFMRFYIDGREMPDLYHKDRYHIPDTVAIPCDTKVIAVHGRNQGFLRAGILASSDGDYILTDSSWKCSNVSYSGWQNVAYNDSFWQPAIDFGPNKACSRSEKDTYYHSVRSISSYARWIWLRQWNGRLNPDHGEMDSQVFCRKTLDSEEIEVNDSAIVSPCQPKQSFKLSITADDSIYLYIDGIRVANLPNGNCLDEPDAIDIPWNTKVIAVHAARFRGSQGGILASSEGSYVLTDSSWKCSNVSFPDWHTVGYNDSLWSPAYDFGSNRLYGMWHNGIFYPGIRSIDREARWIWFRQRNGPHSSTYEQMSAEVFCRKTLNLKECDKECKKTEQQKNSTFSMHVGVKKDSTNSVTTSTGLGVFLGISVVVNLLLCAGMYVLYRKNKSQVHWRSSWSESSHNICTEEGHSQQDENNYCRIYSESL